MGIRDALSKLIHAEMIDGCDVDEIMKIVDLEVAASPIITERVAWPDCLFRAECVPRIQKVWQAEGGGFACHNAMLGYPTVMDENTHRRARARYLLVSKAYMRKLHLMDHRTRSAALSTFFPDGVTVPEMCRDTVLIDTKGNNHAE